MPPTSSPTPRIPADYCDNVLMVPLGATVTWTNDDPGMVHTVTAVDGSFDSGMLQPRPELLVHVRQAG